MDSEEKLDLGGLLSYHFGSGELDAVAEGVPKKSCKNIYKVSTGM